MILIILIIIIILIILYLWPEYECFDDIQIEYQPPTNDIKISDIGYRGVFASRDYNVGEILEVCPCIKQIESPTGKILDYLFSLNETDSLIAFGYCSMYNHSDDANADWKIINENQIKIKTIKPIKKGDEIFISYGDDYWETRDLIKN